MRGARKPDPAPCGSALRPAAALSRAIARGESAALAEFYEARFEGMYARARAMTGRDESFCLDVVQETMLRVARRLRPVNTEEELERWTARVLRSAAIDLLRRETRGSRRELARRSHEETAVVADFTTDPRVRDGLAALGADDVLLLKLRFENGATLDAAGRAVGTSGGAAHGRIRRALRKLRGLLTETRA